MTISARLVALDGTELARFGLGEAYVLARLDLGYPGDRDSHLPLPGRSGEIDTTAYHGASAVTLDIWVTTEQTDSRDVLLDRIRSCCHPARRSYLHITKDGWPAERRMLVRGVEAPVVFDRPGWLRMSVGFKAIDGVMESATLHSQVLYPTTGAQGGITFPITFPITFAAGNVPNAANVTNAGTVKAMPFADIYGYCTNPVVKNLTTGEQFGFTGLTVQPGDFVRVDMAERVALLSNLVGQSRYSQVDFTTSTWWGLDPGTQQVAFIPGNPGASCQALIYWRDTMI